MTVGLATFSETKRQQIFSYWLLGETNVPAQKITAWERQLDDRRSRNGDRVDRGWMLGSALVAGVQGNDDVALQLIDQFYDAGSLDWAWRANNRHESCRILGMIGAATEVVTCLRNGLDEPSYVAPFLETRLPFYDGIRDELEFVNLVDDSLGF
ncbi:MAG: hypothetical protein AB8G17_06565 [Gammaproteobacteria bacterium]